MKELIDRETTVKQICKIGEMVGGHDRDVVISIALFVQDDKTAFPTITIPVAELDTTEDSGEWIDRSDGGRIIYPFWERYECSKCGSRSDITNFCPNCGSDNRPRENNSSSMIINGKYSENVEYGTRIEIDD